MRCGRRTRVARFPTRLRGHLMGRRLLERPRFRGSPHRVVLTSTCICSGVDTLCVFLCLSGTWRALAELELLRFRRLGWLRHELPSSAPTAANREGRLATLLLRWVVAAPILRERAHTVAPCVCSYETCSSEARTCLVCRRACTFHFLELYETVVQ